MSTKTALVFALVLAALSGCSTAQTTEIRREPAKVRYLEIDTRKSEREGIGVGTDAAPVAKPGAGPAMPLPALILSMNVAQSKPRDGVTIKPDGSVHISETFDGVLRLGEASGEKPRTKSLTGEASSSALTFVSNTTRVPLKGAKVFLFGALLIAGGVAAWFAGAGRKWALALIASGLALITIGYLVDAAPWVLWMVFIVGAGGVAWCVYEGRQQAKAESKADALETAIKPVVRAVEDFDLSDDLKAEIAKRAGETLPEVKQTIRDVKRRIGID